MYKPQKAIRLPPFHYQNLKQRYGIENVIGLYGMTEVNIPLYCAFDATKTGSCGKAYECYFDVIIADPQTDEPKLPNELGEILVRLKQAFGFMASYE